MGRYDGEDYWCSEHKCWDTQCISLHTATIKTKEKTVPQSDGLITRTAEVYVCPACRQGVAGHFKYAFKESDEAGAGPQPSSVVDGKLEIVGGVIPEHNCIPSKTRGA